MSILRLSGLHGSFIDRPYRARRPRATPREVFVASLRRVPAPGPSSGHALHDRLDQLLRLRVEFGVGAVAAAGACRAGASSPVSRPWAHPARRRQRASCRFAPPFSSTSKCRSQPGLPPSRRQQEERDAQDQVHAKRRRVARAPSAQVVLGKHARAERERQQRAPEARVEVRDVAEQVAQHAPTATAPGPSRAARSASSAGRVSTSPQLRQFSVETVPRMNSSRCASDRGRSDAVAIAELRDARSVACGTHGREGTSSSAAWSRRRYWTVRRIRPGTLAVVGEDLRRQEPGELQHVGDVVAQPGVERSPRWRHPPRGPPRRPPCPRSAGFHSRAQGYQNARAGRRSRRRLDGRSGGRL